MNGLTNALTGGEFLSTAREADSERSRLAQTYASDLIVEVRMAADQALTVGGLWGFFRDGADHWLAYPLFKSVSDNRRDQ